MAEAKMPKLKNKRIFFSDIKHHCNVTVESKECQVFGMLSKMTHQIYETTHQIYDNTLTHQITLTLKKE